MQITLKDEFGNEHAVSVCKTAESRPASRYFEVLKCCGQLKLKSGKSRCKCRPANFTENWGSQEEPGKLGYLKLVRGKGGPRLYVKAFNLKGEPVDASHILFFDETGRTGKCKYVNPRIEGIALADEKIVSLPPEEDR